MAYAGAFCRVGRQNPVQPMRVIHGSAKRRRRSAIEAAYDEFRLDSHTALMTFLKWAKAEGYEVEPRVLELKRPRVPAQEPTVYHIAQRVRS